MKTQISKLLAELYQLEPELFKKEAELVRIITEMLQNKPDATLDEGFRKELRSKISAEISASKIERNSVSWKHIFAGFLTGGAAIGMASFLLFPSLISAPVNQWSPESIGMLASNADVSTSAVNFGFTSVKKDGSAFGKLSGASSAPNSNKATAPESGVSNKMAPAGTTMALNWDATNAWGEMLLGRMMPIMQDQKNYVYLYSGSTYEVKDTQMGVLQKKKGSLSSSETANFLKNFKISSIDLVKFSELKLTNLTMLEDREYGLNLTIDFIEGAINISKNWNLWPQRNCDANGCPVVKIESIPSDATAIETAKKFMKLYQISTDSYGDPYVNNDWRIQYAQASNKADAYIPENVTVIFPLEINGKKVYEQYGQPQGITVTIDIASNRISEVYGMQKLNFESSDYATEADFSKILEVMKKGGRNIYYIMPISEGSTMTNVDITMNEPELVYSHMYDYKDGESKEYLVPALKFSTTQDPKEGEYFQKTIIVPLIKDFFDDMQGPALYEKRAAQ